MTNSLKLRTSSVLHLPFQSYDQNFTFIVNDKEFQINQFLADLLSPKISHIHLVDPTLTEYSITTKASGNFQMILNLLNFEEHEFTEEEISFISEILENLETTEFDIKFSETRKNEKIEKTNLVNQFSRHLHFKRFYKTQLEKEISEIAQIFFIELNEEERNSFKKFGLEIIENIISHPLLHLETEDQLLHFINQLYLEDSKNSYFYSFVLFSNVSISSMEVFLSIFNIEDFTNDGWNSLSKRLLCEINSDKQENLKRYKRYKMVTKKEILYGNKDFKGLINFLKNESNIDDEINISCSSIGGYNSKNLFVYENTDHYFFTENLPNSWISFEFKKYEIIPSNYTLRSYKNGSYHPKTWVIEGSKDNVNWSIIDKQKNCSFIRGDNLVHTFPIKNENNQSFKYLRIRQTESNWNGNNHLKFDAIEFYGKLIQIY